MSNSRKPAHPPTQPGHRTHRRPDDRRPRHPPAGEPAQPGETCVFHPDCCDPGDPTCTGCGKPATSAATYHAGTAPRRFPHCGEHTEDARIAVQAITRLTTSRDCNFNGVTPDK